LLTPH